HDRLMITRNMDTTSLATTFPFTSSELTQNQGVLYGMNEHNGSLIILDRFSLENSNMVVFAKSGSGKSIAYSEPVLYDDGRGPKLGKIGPLVERLIRQKGSQPIDHELEGVIDPGLKVYSFNQNLKTGWSKVTVAARKKSPQCLYRFTTASGRQISTTADHNLITIKGGQVGAIAGRLVRLGDHLPLARQIQPPQAAGQTQFNLLQLLKQSSHVYVSGFGKFIKSNVQKLKAARLNPRLDRYFYHYGQGRPLPLNYFYQIIDFLGIKPIDSKLGKILLGSRELDPKTTWPAKINLSLPLLKFLGFYLAEGCCGPSFVSISQNQGEAKTEIISILRKLGLNFFTTPKGVIIPNRVFTEIIKALNLGSSAGSKKMPAFIFNQPVGKISQLLRFYFEGDGTVDTNDVAAVSKSKQLISQIAYLLLYFGIIARVKKVFKRAGNAHHDGNFYWQLTISGADNLQKFKRSIGFVSSRKNSKLKQIISRRANTNVDVVPSLEPVLKELYQLLYASPEIPSPVNLSPLKRGVFKPSPQELKRLITNIETRINQLEAYPQNGFGKIKDLPALESLSLDAHAETKRVFRLLKTVEGYDYSLPAVKEEIYHAFQVLGVSLEKFDRSLWTTITQRPQGDTGYNRLIRARQFLEKEFALIQAKIATAKKLLQTLTTLAQADIFWDPVVKIDKLKAKRPYVYDLTVDNNVFLAGYAGLFVHNSYLVKLEALRSLMFDTEIIIIDPENEYETLCKAVGGQYINFSFSAQAKINPFDLS
ncbi:MAG: LAGLIDADG family homing endonuclease, partial [Patescibacteria group bacterium]|nr:LAGLIDADG family homing endonuclease [Patescibacteria group bacterium]